jgi:hypothetical protein
VIARFCRNQGTLETEIAFSGNVVNKSAFVWRLKADGFSRTKNQYGRMPSPMLKH